MHPQRIVHIHPKVNGLIEMCGLFGEMTLEAFLPFLQEYFQSPTLRQAKRTFNYLRRQKRLFDFEKGKFKISEQGHHIQKNGDVSESWNQSWDGYWFLVSFDLPINQNNDRRKFWRHLRSHKIGRIQGSLWVSHKDPSPILSSVTTGKLGLRDMCVFPSNQIQKFTNDEVVSTAWNWETIRKKQESYLHRVSRLEDSLENAKSSSVIGSLVREEVLLYADAFLMDPLLPVSLWPKKYLGEKVHSAHALFLKSLSRQKVLK